MLVFPEAPENSSCVTVLVPTELVPIVGGLFRSLELRRAWLTDSDWQSGYRAFVALEAQLMNSCLADLVQEIRDFRGVLPDFESTPVEERTSAMYNSVNDIKQALVDMRGVLVDGWFTDTTATLADIVRAVRGSDQTTGASIWSGIAELIGTGASLASIASFIANLLTSQEETVVEGGLLIAQIAVTAGMAAMIENLALAQTVQATNIQSILEALRGSTAIEDNVMLALRGTTDASATRNVATLLD